MNVFQDIVYRKSAVIWKASKDQSISTSKYPKNFSE